MLAVLIETFRANSVAPTGTDILNTALQNNTLQAKTLV